LARKTPRKLAAVVMAAGKGMRLRSAMPKVLHRVAGRPILWHVLEALRGVRPDRVVVVVGHGRDEVEDAVRAWDPPLPVRFAHQDEPLGTGHAVMVAERAVGRPDDVLVLPGDEPLVTVDQLRALLRVLRRRDVAAAVQVTVPDDPRAFTSVIREGNRFVRMDEHHPAEGPVEVATSVYAFRREELFRALPLLDRENRQREYYLFEVLGILRDKGEAVAVHRVDNGGAVGANSRAEVAAAEAVMRRRINEALMEAGVRLSDPARIQVDVGVRVGRDTHLLPGTYLSGDTRIGEGCLIGPDTTIEDSRIDDGATVERSAVRGARIGPEATVGPFTHIRPGTELGPRTKAGSFVEIKASKIGEGSKVPHLAYVGDAVVGRNVNIGAGTITVNYDGYEKHRTVIEDDVRIGSDTMLVAPVRVGKGAVTGAGSVITKDVPAGALAVERSEQRVVPGYRRRKDKQKGKTRKHGGGKA
jgi:bifunctional UDP-N-acetylglucosamine pyrophosphorylase/glucosamine-1-phosphate N-acetyltransferase